MDQALPVRVIEGAGELDRMAQHLVNRQWTSDQPIGERLALEVLHDQERDRRRVRARCLRVRGLADIVQTADIRMIERCNGAGFTLEPLSPGAVGRELAGQHLDRDRAIETDVSRLVDLAHAAGPEEPEHVIWTEARAGGQPHVVFLGESLTQCKGESVYGRTLTGTIGNRSAVVDVVLARIGSISGG